MADKRARKQPGSQETGRPADRPRIPSATKHRSGKAPTSGGRGATPGRGLAAHSDTRPERRPSRGQPDLQPRSRATSHAPLAGREDRSPQAVLSSYRPDLSQILEGAGLPGFRHAQVLEHLLHRPGVPFAEASSLPGGLRSSLDQAGASTLAVVATRRASDGTTKLLLEARDGAQVEAVLMPYGDRLTVCISSQVGCAVACGFCATGALGFRRNLSAAEIVDQLRAAVAEAAAGQRLTNVVYMGMGEPLLNLEAVLDSVRVLTAPAGLGLGHRSLSISTVGIPRGILRLAQAEPQVNLALSLHAADDPTRALLIPDRFRHPLSEILEAAWQHFDITRRKLLVEYVLIAGLNDSIDDARRLAALLRGHVVTVNLLAWNPVCPDDSQAAMLTGRERAGRKRLLPETFLPSSPAAVAAFRAALRAAHIEAVVRQSKGAGIEAACGQLAGTTRSYAKD